MQRARIAEAGIETGSSRPIHVNADGVDAPFIGAFVKGVGIMGVAQTLKIPLRGYRRAGTLWNSRNKSSLIDADGCLLSCMRYIELNPMRAAMVDDPAHYRRSSYRSNALGQDNERLTPHPVFLELGRTKQDRPSTSRAIPRQPRSGGNR